MGFGNGFDNGASISRRMNSKYPTKPKKTVFDRHMAIHVWAQRSQSWGRNAKGSHYFDGDTLYSYGDHYVAAKFVNDRKGNPIVLLNNDRSYGPTTNDQVWAAGSAVAESTPRFYVKRPNVFGDSDHIDNLRAMFEAYKAHKADSENKRKRADTRFAALERANSVLETMRAYRGHFLKAKQFAIPSNTGDVVRAKHDAQWGNALREFKEAKELWETRICHKRGYGSGQKASIANLCHHLRTMLRSYATLRRIAVAGDVLPALDVARTIQLYRAYRASYKRAGWYSGTSYHGRNFGSWAAYRERDAIKKIDERNAWAQEAVDNARYALEVHKNSVFMLEHSERALSKVPAHCETWGLPIPVNYAETVDAICVALDAARIAERKARQDKLEAERDKVAAWRACKPNVRPSYEWPVMLRRVGNTVQTTKGAEFPVDDATRAWPVIKACYDAGRTWKRNGVTLPMGHFQVDVIKADGTIIAGCHTIERKEIERFAGVLGL